MALSNDSPQQVNISILVKPIVAEQAFVGHFKVFWSASGTTLSLPYDFRKTL